MKKSNLFLDESGKSSLAEETSNPFILTGVILDDDEVTKIEGFFNYIKRKYDIDESQPFHSYHIFENESTRVDLDKSKALAATLAEFISLIPIKINIVSVDKEDFKKALGVISNEDFKGRDERREMKEYPYRIMSAELFKWFARYLKHCDRKGEIIVDARRGAESQLIKSLNLCKDPNGPLTLKDSQIIEERCNAICFADKFFLSGGLEITDLISFVVFFEERNLSSVMLDLGLEPLWKSIKLKLEDQIVYRLDRDYIKYFFKVGEDGVHKHLRYLRGL